ncbi:MAG: hypothetical protein DBY45_10145 [Clostridiales bacterium]|nr:MAG: hypothetical protein DBY45_10145 [Clostridiales bacterium]
MKSDTVRQVIGFVIGMFGFILWTGQASAGSLDNWLYEQISVYLFGAIFILLGVIIGATDAVLWLRRAVKRLSRKMRKIYRLVSSVSAKEGKRISKSISFAWNHRMLGGKSYSGKKTSL